MMTNFVTLTPTDTVKDAADKLLAGSDQDLIVIDNNQAIGVMTRMLIIDSLRGNGLTTSVVDVMNRSFDTVQISDRLTDVYADAQQKPSAFYPVLEKSQFRGVIDLNNINEFVAIRAILSQ